MPLSEHEQKLLEQMERALYAEDPKFASQMKGRRANGPSRRRLFVGIAIAIAGLACIVAAVSVKLIWLGAVGFAVMVAGVAWAFQSGSERVLTDTATGQTHRARRSKAGKSTRRNSGTFMQRLENRWDERRRGGAY